MENFCFIFFSFFSSFYLFLPLFLNHGISGSSLSTTLQTIISISYTPFQSFSQTSNLPSPVFPENKTTGYWNFNYSTKSFLGRRTLIGSPNFRTKLSSPDVTVTCSNMAARGTFPWQPAVFCEFLTHPDQLVCLAYFWSARFSKND